VPRIGLRLALAVFVVVVARHVAVTALADEPARVDDAARRPADDADRSIVELGTNRSTT
jgi:hypothetical protein